MTNKINEVPNYIMTQEGKSDIVKGVVKSSSKSPRSSSEQKAGKKKESTVRTAAAGEPKKRVSSKSKTKDSEPQPPSGTGSGEWDEIEFYCVKCKTKNKCKPGLIELEKDKRGSSRLKGMCTVCETKLYRYYSAPVESSGSGKE